VPQLLLGCPSGPTPLALAGSVFYPCTAWSIGAARERGIREFR